MREIVVGGNDTKVKMRSSFGRAIDGLMGKEKGHYYTVLGMKRKKELWLTDRQAELEFFRWASVLDEEIVLCTWGPNHHNAGHVISTSDMPDEGETIDEAKTIYQWGLELAALENTPMTSDSPGIQRMHNIARMFIDAKLTWKGGPKWWRQL